MSQLELYSIMQGAKKSVEDRNLPEEEAEAEFIKINKLYKLGVRKLKREEKADKIKKKLEDVEAGLEGPTDDMLIERAGLLKLKYHMHSKFKDTAEAKEALRGVCDADEWLTKPGGRRGSSWIRGHHLTHSGLAFKLSAKSLKGECILWSAVENEDSAFDELEGTIEMETDGDESPEKEADDAEKQAMVAAFKASKLLTVLLVKSCETDVAKTMKMNDEEFEAMEAKLAKAKLDELQAVATELEIEVKSSGRGRPSKGDVATALVQALKTAA